MPELQYVTKDVVMSCKYNDNLYISVNIAKYLELLDRSEVFLI